ncbi:MAG: M20/M25/M40 family metallo-hydrolase [Caldilineaceae bacterium]|jgi:putative aminopeptidase FrvX|nr:M20/M25/M40 family metallo-hydrolase [Caldilineaceae bacterium]
MNDLNHPALSLFSELLVYPSPSGMEHKMAAHLRRRLEGWGYTPQEDGAGNVWVRLPGRDQGARLVCYAAHTDEIGLAVHAIEPDGRLRVSRSGGLLPWKLGETPVEILGDHATITGVLSMGAGHGAREQTLEWSDVCVITGLTPDQLAEAGVRPGSLGAPLRSHCGPVLFGDPADPLVGAWTFDDRMGVVALLRLLETLAAQHIQPARPTLIAFTVQEEVGGMGAKVLARREQPEVFIAVDGCPLTPGSPLVLDGRPGIWTLDRVAPYDARLIADLRAAALAAGTELQPVAYDVSASDASMVFDAGGAARIACFGQVRENSHGYEVARLAVFDNMLRTLLHFVEHWS